MAIGLSSITDAVGRLKGAVVRQQTVGKVRKHFIGRGDLARAPAKAAVIRACRQRGWRPVDDNEADALALLDYAISVVHADGWDAALGLAA